MASKKSKKSKEPSVVNEEMEATQKVGESEAAGNPEDSAEEIVVSPENKVTDLTREVNEWKDKYLRAKAEQQNAAKRAANELEESIRYANTGLLRSLLDIVDDFERTVEASANSDSVATVVEGMKLIENKVEKLLKDHHVEAIEAEKVPFDPSRHAALMQQPTVDHEPGTVIQQIQKGYILRDRVLRPAQVIVASAPTEQEEAVSEDKTSGKNATEGKDE